jgi:predicted DNA-binding protein YlxM (UPF0122 family)
VERQTERDSKAHGLENDPAEIVPPERIQVVRVTKKQDKKMRGYREIGLSYDEIADVMALPKTTVYNRTKDVVSKAETSLSKPSSTGQENEMIMPISSLTEIPELNQIVGHDRDVQSHTVNLGPDDHATKPIEQRINVVISPAQLKWSSNMGFLVGSAMIESGYDDVELWLKEVLLPVWRISKKTREYIPHGDEQDFYAKFENHMNNSLAYLKLLQKVRDEYLRRTLGA